MIILLQSVTIQFRRLFRHISYYKMRQSNFITKDDRLLLQGASGITKCDRLLLQSASGVTKCDRLYYKVHQVLQNVTVITKRDVTQLGGLYKTLTIVLRVFSDIISSASDSISLQLVKRSGLVLKLRAL